MKTVACIIARTNSTRLPKKVLREIQGKMLIEHIIDSLKTVSNLDEIYVCTSVEEEDAVLVDIAKKNGVKGYRGSPDSVIDRMLDVAELEQATHVVRVTGDNVFTDSVFLERMIAEQKDGVEYTRTELLPIGVTAEVITTDALKKCKSMIDPNKSEYMMLYLFNPNNFHCLVLVPPKKLQFEFSSLTVDTPDDFTRTEFIFEELKDSVSYPDIIELNKLKKIPFFEIPKNTEIKLPKNETITYEKMRADISKKIATCKVLELEDDFYEN